MYQKPVITDIRELKELLPVEVKAVEPVDIVRKKSRTEFEERWKKHRSFDYTRGSSIAAVAPFVRFIRRNEEALSKKVAQLSILLREARGIQRTG